MISLQAVVAVLSGGGVGVGDRLQFIDSNIVRYRESVCVGESERVRESVREGDMLQDAAPVLSGVGFGNSTSWSYHLVRTRVSWGRLLGFSFWETSDH